MGILKEIYKDIKCIVKYIYHDITCKHELEFVRNLHGDPVRLYYGWNRSEWRCKKCGNYKLHPDLHNYTPKEYIEYYDYK